MQKTRMVWAVLLAVALAMVGARPAAGQALQFELPDSTVDLSRYETLEQCMAAVARVAKRFGAQQVRAAAETMDPFEFHEFRILGGVGEKQPLPPEVAETARACLAASAEYTDTVSVSLKENYWRARATMYLIAGWEDSARAVVDQRIAAVDPDSAEALKRLLLEVLSFFHGRGTGFDYMRLRPPQPDLGDEIVLANVGKLKSARDRLQMYTQMFVTGRGGHGEITDANEAGARTRRNLARLQAMLDSVAESEMQRWIDEDPGAELDATASEWKDRLEAIALNIVGGPIMRDSLRVSTDAYVRVKRETWARAAGETPDAYPLGPIGERAPRLEGDIWLGCEEDPCEPRPRPGRVSLVYFGEPGQLVNVPALRRGAPWITSDPRERLFVHPGTCSESGLILRRFAERFPELDVTYVTAADGLHGLNKEGITPEREAQLEYECLQAFGLDRLTLSMTVPLYWTLPEPDGRRVYREPDNWKNYKFGGSWKFWMGMSGLLLIDQDGYVVHVDRAIKEPFGMNLSAFEEFDRLIEVLLERGRSGT